MPITQAVSLGCIVSGLRPDLPPAASSLLLKWRGESRMGGGGPSVQAEGPFGFAQGRPETIQPGATPQVAGMGKGT